MMDTPRIAFVTGGGGNIGSGIVQRFAEGGHRVAVVDRKLDAAEAVAVEVNAQVEGTPCVAIGCDVSDESEVAHAVERCVGELGGLDVLINNAGWGNQVPDIAAFDRQTWDAILATNLTGPMLLMKHASEHLAAGYDASLPHAQRVAGAVVNMSSIRAMQSRQPNYAYSASKAGLIGITHDLAMSLGPAIRVNAVAPGWIASAEYLATQASEPLHALQPAGRIGHARDIAEACWYLCSPAAGFVTGEVLTVDGGMRKLLNYADH
jgi:NAD(P)-dependent dehydrogenase (short-subunit alcohol dehydrogenase family)